jgi:hypothetical protein
VEELEGLKDIKDIKVLENLEESVLQKDANNKNNIHIYKLYV